MRQQLCVSVVRGCRSYRRKFVSILSQSSVNLLIILDPTNLCCVIRKLKSIPITLMHRGQANRFCAVLFVLASFFRSGFAAQCPFATSRLGGIGDEYAFSSANKLSVLGFSATVTYASLPAGKCSICAHALTYFHPYSILALV